MNIDQAFPSNYLKAANIEEDTTLTIGSVTLETIGEDKRPSVHFDNNDKGLVLNKTNASTIKGLYGSETDDWTGKKITLFATEVDYQGKQTMAIRIRMRMRVTKTGAAPAAVVVKTDPTSAFWTYAYKHEITKTDAAAYLNETADDFDAALKLMQAQTENASRPSEGRDSSTRKSGSGGQHGLQRILRREKQHATRHAPQRQHAPRQREGRKEHEGIQLGSQRHRRVHS
jgi:hypothetical protein